jgi:chromosome segregation ATPase
LNFLIPACPDCYQDLEDLYLASLTSLGAQVTLVQNLTTEVSDLAPFDDRLQQYQSDITDLQTEALDLLRMQNELMVLYDDILLASNVTLRDQLTQINGSLDDLKRRFTTVYVITFTAQELLNVTVSEFLMALELVRRIETVDLPFILNRSEVILASSIDVANVARQVESTRANFAAQVEELRNVTNMILSLSASILSSAEQLRAMQESILEDVENIVSTYSSLDSEIEEVESSVPRLELNLVSLTQRLEMLHNSLPECPGREDIVYLTRNATEAESYISSDILTEITNQARRLLALNQTNTAFMAEFQQLYQQVSNLGGKATTLLQLISAAFQESSEISDRIRDLFDQSEMVADNLENFNNVTFRVGNEVAEALADVNILNRNASMAFSEAQRIEQALRALSTEIRSAKEVAISAFNISSSSFSEVIKSI